MKRLATVLLLVFFAAACASSQTGRRSPKADSRQEPLANLAGTVKLIDRKLLIVEDPDANTLEFRCSKKTSYLDRSGKLDPSAIKPGDDVSVEARRELDGSLEAVTIHLDRSKR